MRAAALATVAAVPIMVAAAAGASATVSPPTAGRAASEANDATVDASWGGADGVLQSGVPTFRTIGGALAAAPASTARYAIFIRNGRYYEKLSVERADVTFIGESRDGVVLTFDAAAGHTRPQGGAWGTRGSFTLRVAAPRFLLRDMTVENGFDYASNAALPPTDPSKVQDAQAVAVLLDRGSDQAVFEDCTVRGHQDTLFADAGRAFFGNCRISGHVDFIFGAGQVVFESCDIVSLDRGSRTNNGYIAAPSTLLAQPYGFLFLRSRLLKETPDMAPGTVVLGRPWHPSRNPQAVGSAVFIDCFMEDHISAAGWAPMSGFEPADARLFEHGSHGPGAIPSETRRVLSDAEARYHTLEQVLRGWDPRADTANRPGE